MSSYSSTTANRSKSYLDQDEKERFLEERSPDTTGSESSDCLTGHDDNIPSNSHSPERRITIILYSITTILLFSDQNLLSPNLTAIADEFNFSSLERDEKLGGHIALGFFLLGAPASFLIGVLADHYPNHRSTLFALTVAIGEGACFGTYFTKTYTGLFITRILTGFSIGGAIPIIYSVLGDMFTAAERAKASSKVTLGCGIGISLGQGVAGFLGPRYGWRMPFLVVSIPALVSAALVLICVKDPARGGMERAVLEKSIEKKVEIEDGINYESEGVVPENAQDDQGDLADIYDGFEEHDGAAHRRGKEPKSMEGSLMASEKASGTFLTAVTLNKNEQLEADVMNLVPKPHQNGLKNFLQSLFPSSAKLESLKYLLKTPTVIITLLQGAPGCTPWGIVNVFLNDYLSEDRGMSVEGATFVLLLFGGGVFIGIMTGGFLGTHLYSRFSPKHPPLAGGLALILACFPFFILINTVTSQTPLYYTTIISTLAGTAAGITGPIVKATLTNVTLPASRGLAFALLTIFDDFGKGLGPLFVASLIKVFDGNRMRAFNVGMIGWILCGLFNAAIYFFVERDEEKVQWKIAEEGMKELEILNRKNSFDFSKHVQSRPSSPTEKVIELTPDQWQM